MPVPNISMSVSVHPKKDNMDAHYQLNGPIVVQIEDANYNRVDIFLYSEDALFLAHLLHATVTEQRKEGRRIADEAEQRHIDDEIPF